MPLFNSKTLRNALASFTWEPSPLERAAAEDWAQRAADPLFDLQNESQLEQEFNRIVLQQVLGYAAPAPGVTGTMQVKQAVPGGTIVDVALGNFSNGQASIIAPLELKGPKVALDRIMPGRAKTPVQQAWDYAMDAPGARWVLVCNMKEFRLYAFGHGRQLYESFDLRKINQPEELRRFRLLLDPDRLLTGTTAEILARSAQADRDVTNQLYRDYKELRTKLTHFVQTQHPEIGVEDRIRLVQTLLDRLLFIAFAEDKGLLPSKSLAGAIEYRDPYFPRPRWEQLCKLFEWVDKGAPPNNIPRYNGGLFAADPLIDDLALPDHIVEAFSLIAEYDFASEISVTILGHIFEQSISDIENEKAVAGLELPPPTPKKKREGVVYTPDFITRFVVEQTIGRHLAEISEELLPAHGTRDASGAVRWRNKTGAEANYWNGYLDRLTSLRILDPACGSGAFLIAAFNFLNAEQKRVRDRLGELRPGLLAYASPNADVEIITNNLFGVDVNAESVEITKLALWLQTAKRDRALESLDGNILHGNSLVDDPKFHSRPFDWKQLTDSFDTANFYSNDKSYIIPASSPALAGYLNSNVAWFILCGMAPAVRGGFREARVQYVGALPVPSDHEIEQALRLPSEIAGQAADTLDSLIRSTLNRLNDLDPRISASSAMRNWPSLTFADLQTALSKRFKISIPVTERDAWESWFDTKRAEATALSCRIADAEAAINASVYGLFGLTETEIGAIEGALAGTACP